ncbi:IS21 family transposase [Salegentibacter sp. JZCK2]|uniref:IS21 family transposase n=1 Tax=Salegentibacter tibetensis TaxID=2873600 RepID=UPI001CCE2B40|nr:IS21 family transposase [Salegentibacter tibetensis]MBZ9731677.1 IS21 family transposase [Salegentibacter tibetensis]
MANNPIGMREVRELLRLYFKQGLSGRKAAKVAGIGKTAASQYIAGFKSSGISISAISGMNDSELINLINIRKQTQNPRYTTLEKLFPYFEKELKKVGVTLHLLWEEYRQTRKDGYEYSQFCHHYYHWRKESKVSMHMEHKAGDKLFVDFTGKKLYITDPATGEREACEVFVSVLGCSQLCYIEAVPSQKKEDWIAVNQNALQFYGGAPAAIVPDCLRSAVSKSNKYEPKVNQTYQDFGEHYGTVILPARALHPQDKSLAENFVRLAYQRIYAPLRNEVFYSLEELNQALWEKLELHNKKNFQHKSYSRQSLFDQVEKQELKALPTTCYELKHFSQLKVQYNHHIYLKADKHYYSIPFKYTGKKVKVIYTLSNVEAYYNNERIALHQRNRKPYGYTTKNEHRPAHHQFQAEWTSERFISWGRSIGPEVEQLIAKILDSRPHPEQAYRSCMGLLNLAKKHPKPAYRKACKKALEMNCLQYKFIKNILHNKTFDVQEEPLELFELPTHNNIRGKENFN